MAKTKVKKTTVGKTFSNIKSVTQFLSDATDGFKGTDFTGAIAASIPWLGVAGESVAEAVPPIKFLVKFFDGMTKEHDPEQLGIIACSTAYQQSIEQALRAFHDPKKPQKIKKEAKKRRQNLKTSKKMKFKNFSFGDALNHPFIKDSDSLLNQFAEAIGYNKAERQRLTGEVHTRFVGNLKTMLSHG